jgi:Holliday junction resolvase
LKEADITKQIRHYLNCKGIFHYKAWQGLGSERGVADIIGIYMGKPLAIEVKSEKGRLSKYQERWLKRFENAGGIAFVARSVDDVEERLAEEFALISLKSEAN